MNDVNKENIKTDLSLSWKEFFTSMIWLFGFGVLVYFGAQFLTFYTVDTRADEWVESCTEYMVMSYQQRAEASSEKKVSFRNCKIVANRAFCDLNLVGDKENIYQKASDSRGNEIFSLVRKRCPIMLDFETGDTAIYEIALKQIEKQGPLNFIERLMPAEDIIKKALMNKYSGCQVLRSKVRLQNDKGKCFDILQSYTATP